MSRAAFNRYVQGESNNASAREIDGIVRDQRHDNPDPAADRCADARVLRGPKGKPKTRAPGIVAITLAQGVEPCASMSRARSPDRTSAFTPRTKR
jgi:hypothetical protein